MANVINQPDGSSASPKNPPDPAAADAPSWTERYEVDFTAEATSAALDSNDTVTIGGVDWTVRNGSDSVYCDEMQIVNGSGLVVSPDSGTSEFYKATSSTFTAPRIQTHIQSGSAPIYSALGISQPFAIQAIITAGGTDLSADFDEWGITLTNNLATYFVTSARMYSASAFSGIGARLERYVNGVSGAATVDAGSAESAPHTFFELVYYPGGTVVASSSAAADFVEPLSATTFQKFVTTNTAITSTGSSVNWVNTDMWVCLFIANNGSSTAFEAVIQKCRLLTLGS